jgi:subtilisin family serine protease
MVILDQSTMVILDNPDFAAFGHGTMVAGVIHLVAPQATIMPLKAFKSDGTGYSSDVLRAIYYAVYNGAKVLNMSFSYTAPSYELGRAIDFATSRGLAAIGSAGNTGQHVAAYPAALPNVIGVASTDDSDVLSGFSNYGADLFLLAAPGEGIVTTYPLGTYAAAWGTSFSAPFAAGTAALLAQLSPSIDQGQVTTAVSDAVPVEGVARGRLDVFRAVNSRMCSLVCP